LKPFIASILILSIVFDVQGLLPAEKKAGKTGTKQGSLAAYKVGKTGY